MNGLHHPIQLSRGSINGNVMLAPMAGYTDLAFRSIAIDSGADFTFTEMVSAEAIRRGNKKTLRLGMPAPNETSFGIQIFTGDAGAAEAAVAALASYRPALFDLNCGCSVPKILKSGAGAKLLQEPGKIGAIVRAMVRASPIPVSVKLRLGWDASSHVYVAAAEEAVAGGACLVTLHPRTRAQGFSGKADWEHIRILKTRVGVPVIGSGDIFNAADAARLLATTGCDGVMLARGAIGNPFIFGDIRDVLAGRPPAGPKPPEARFRVALRHLELLMTYKPELVAAREMRKHFARYAAGLDHAAALRRAANRAVSFGDYAHIVESFLSGELKD